MGEARAKLLTQVALLLAAGAIIGYLYGYAERGLLIAAVATLAWQLRKLLAFEKALRTNRFDDFQIGEGIWEQIYSRVNHQKNRTRYYKQKYRKLVKEVRKSTNAMPDGGIVLNASFEVVVCNSAAQELVGFKRKKDRGQRVDNILRDPRFSRYLDSDDYSSGVEIMSPIHEDHWLFCRMVPYGGDQHLLLIRDVTEHRRLTTMRRDFVANASHELRSPLTVISGYLDSLGEDEEMPEDWRKPIEQMQSQALRMNNIVSELLELSKLEAKGPATAKSAVDIQALLALTKKSWSGVEGTPEIEVRANSHARLLGKASELESVIANLVSNAVRHTPPGGRIVLEWNSDADGGRLSVSDNGEGIAEENLPRLTERFFRVDAGRAREDGGIGLGLAIVKHALSRHDAELEIDSTLGEGSTFTCVFPASRLSIDEPVALEARGQL